MLEIGTENAVSRASSTTAAHLPSQDHSAAPASPPGPADCCDLVTVPARQGLEAVDILRRGAGEGDGVGPVLHDGSCDTLGFLVPPGTADGWDLPGSACTQTFGHGVSVYSAEPEPVPAPPVAGTGWLLPPSGEADPVTDPAVLRAALGLAARTIEAADSCR
ncbi:hypothetical protein OG453_10300 [Streptomyces sp. NBC_01381]|uniref:hypothetical protein n=1 Tax=Streptomyces sp. NBC_01381 TaxID=2903845 RepID=UPI00225AE8DA|nr:hypothetical protein [Streptomyces sp. NBC_01381]MCX4667051.1 hypothetical protein [Streptomyces sp. NBC_01381]